jgi:hypothetical protein
MYERSNDMGGNMVLGRECIQRVAVLADGVTPNLIKLALWAFGMSIGQVNVRIVSPLPVLGDLYWVRHFRSSTFTVAKQLKHFCFIKKRPFFCFFQISFDFLRS